MGLAIYSEAVAGTDFSQSGTFTNPLLESLDGGDGGSVDRLYYVRNDDALFTYSGIALSLSDTESESIIDGTGGFEWKLSDGVTRPTEDQWDLIVAGASIDMGDLGTPTVSDTSTFLPFWLRQTIPRNSKVRTYVDVEMLLDATQVTI